MYDTGSKEAVRHPSKYLLPNESLSGTSSSLPLKAFGNHQENAHAVDTGGEVNGCDDNRKQTDRKQN